MNYKKVGRCMNDTSLLITLIVTWFAGAVVAYAYSVCRIKDLEDKNKRLASVVHHCGETIMAQSIEISGLLSTSMKMEDKHIN